MDARHDITHGTWRLLIAAIVALALVTTVGTASVSAASKGCSVKNMGTGQTYSTLQSAVSAAKPKTTMLLSGTCRGKVTIRKSVTVKGVTGGGTGRPTILGWKDFGRIMKVRPSVTVVLQSLVVDSGVKRLPNRPSHKGAGGAIKNFGTLVLRDVVVRNYHAPNEGGAVFNRGTLILNGRTRITNNRAGAGNYGGGVLNATPRARLTMNDSSRIIGNRGGGVGNSGGVVVLNDRSAIIGNEGGKIDCGGGVAFGDGSEGGRIVLNDSSRIIGNRGGGVCTFGGTVVLNDSSRISGNITDRAGGGVSADEGMVVMNDSSVISNNKAAEAGGVRAESLRMNGSSVIRFNSARVRSGGVHLDSADLAGVTCGPGGNVDGNRPDDCYFAE